MKNKNKKPNFGHKKNKKWTVYPLLFLLLGIFLLPKTAYFSYISEEKIIELTNKERAKRGLENITANQLLSKAATEKGRDILLNQKFQHTFNERGFSAWIKDAGYEYAFAGENLAIDFVTSEGAIQAWLDSPTHKKNMLNADFSEIGVAVLEGNFQGKNTTLVVQIFGTPLYSGSEAKNPADEYFKKNENIILGFTPESDSLLTNAQSNSLNYSLLDPGLEIYEPRNYLAILKINPGEAQWEKRRVENGYVLAIAYLFALSGIIFLGAIFSPRYTIDKKYKAIKA